MGNGQVELIYDDGGFVRSGDGGSANVDARATITLLSKSQFQLGSTVYRRYWNEEIHDWITGDFGGDGEMSFVLE